MNKPGGRIEHNVKDSIQARLTSYAFNLNYSDLTTPAIRTAKAHVIDTLGALIGGYFAEPCRIVRKLAAQMPDSRGATVIGTRMKTTPDMAAFINATTARYAEFNDVYNWPGSYHGHVSDTIMPLLAVAEHAQVSGREFIAGVVLAYEVFCRISDVFQNGKAFCNTNFACIATAVAAGKLLGLSSQQLAHCISMAVVPNVILRQVRLGHLSMFKTVAAGQAGRAGVFAALLARAGMEGPHLPFEGSAGWCDQVAGSHFSLDTLGGSGVPFKILSMYIKIRPAGNGTIASILAAEKIAPLDVDEVQKITVETYKFAKERLGTGELRWNPESREAADHSIPYVVAVALMDGTVTLRSYDDAHLRNPTLRALMQKIEVVENQEFTTAFDNMPQEHRSRVTVLTLAGKRLVGEAGGDQDDMATPKSDAQFEDKFRRISEDVLGAKRMDAILERLWRLEELANMAEIPPSFALD